MNARMLTLLAAILAVPTPGLPTNQATSLPPGSSLSVAIGNMVDPSIPFAKHLGSDVPGADNIIAKAKPCDDIPCGRISHGYGATALNRR